MSTPDPIHRILYVDDEAEVGVAFSRSARRLGFETDLATSGAEAIRLARTRFYAVVATDLRMPGLDGLALIERLSLVSPATAFVLVTGMPDLDLRASRLADNAIASIIAKPWEEEELAGTLQRAFALHQQRTTDGGRGVEAQEGPRLLLVEDNAADAELLQELLAADFPPAAFVVATRLRTALEHLHEEGFAAILTDLALPDARGFDAITRLQAAAPETPVLVVSGLADDSLAQQAVQLGAQDFLVKGQLDPAGVQRAVRHAQERKRVERRLMRLAHFDSLTGLANRSTFHERVTQALTRARRRGTRFAVLYLDLDRFKQVNDTLGHDAGDTLLEEVGRRILHAVREYDTVARLGGDEFAVLADELIGSEALAGLEQRIQAAFQDPVLLDGAPVEMACSIGVAEYPEAARTVPELIKCADRALYQAKRNGRNRVVRYNGAQGSSDLLHAALSVDVNVALKRGEFGLHFQPQVSLDGYRLVGFEALLRWRRGEELIPPAVFVPLLEESGGMVAVGHWALEEGCRRLAAWRDGGATDLRLALNMTRGQIEEPGLAVHLGSVLGAHRLPPEALELEVIEQVLMRDTYRLNLALTELKALGVRLAVKGFGTGFASRDVLARFRVDALKASRGIVSAAPDDPEGAAVLRAIAHLGERLGIGVVAEGVEHRGQLAAARAAGCCIAQGFLFGRPRPDWTLPASWEPLDDQPA